MKKSSLFTSLSLLFIGALWIYSLFHVPTFDLDESLYRRVAEEMKWNQDYWHPIWDGKPLNHKPPIFYWLIVIFSRIFDGAQSGVSILSARLPSLLSTIGILFSIAWFQRKPEETKLSALTNTTLIWGCTFFPLITSCAVIFDPLQTLALMPSLLIPHRAFSKNESLQIKDYFWISVSMILATAIKGLTGLIIPTLAIALHSLVFDYRKIVRAGFQFLIWAFLPAVVVCASYFWFLDHQIGRAFTEEFFLVHHFGRGTQAMEAHHGPFYYYILIVLFGGGLLIPLLAYFMPRVSFTYKKWGYPLSFAISTLLFFSLSATKLPHYSWPIWPALVLQFLILIRLPSKREFLSQQNVWNFFSIPIAILGAGLFYLILNYERFPAIQIDDGELFLLSAGATLCLLLPFFLRKFTRQPEYVSFFMSMIALLITIPASSIVEKAMVSPFHEAVMELKKRNPGPQDKLRYAGPMSASLSLAIGQEIDHHYFHNRSESNDDYRYLLVIQSKKQECANDRHQIIFENKSLVLCEKK